MKKPPETKGHRFDLLQSVTVIKMMRNNTTNEVATIVKVYRDQKQMQASFVLDDQDLYDAIKNIDPFYRREIVEALIDLPRVRRVEVTDEAGTGFGAEN